MRRRFVAHSKRGNPVMQRTNRRLLCFNTVNGLESGSTTIARRFNSASFVFADSLL